MKNNYIALLLSSINSKDKEQKQILKNCFTVIRISFKVMMSYFT